MKKINFFAPFFCLILILGLVVISCSEDKKFDEETSQIAEEIQVKASELPLENAENFQSLDEKILETAATDLNQLYVLYLSKLELISTNQSLTEEDITAFLDQYQTYDFAQLEQDLKESSFFTSEVLNELAALNKELFDLQSVERRMLLVTSKVNEVTAVEENNILAHVLNGYLKTLEAKLAPTAGVRDCYSDCVALNTYSGLYWAYYNSAYCPPHYSYWQCRNYRHSFALASIKQHCLTLCPPALPSRRVELYEGNNGTQDLVGVIDISYNRSVRFKSHSCCENDEARSMKIFNMKAGERLAVYDDSDPNNPDDLCGDTKDDWMCLRAKRDFSYKLINTFERNPRSPGILINDADVIAFYGDDGNLDGKVSRFKKK